jgi:hypothetical protein
VRHRRGLASVAFATILGGCGFLGLGVNNLNYDEAEAELRRLVDDGLAAGLKGKLDLPKSDVYDHPCGESDEEEVYPEYSYHFPLEMLGPDPDSFATRVADYWRSEDFELFADDADPGINGSFAEKGEFNLQVFVNRITKALVGGSGPCVPKPS